MTERQARAGRFQWLCYQPLPSFSFRGAGGVMSIGNRAALLARASSVLFFFTPSHSTVQQNAGSILPVGTNNMIFQLCASTYNCVPLNGKVFFHYMVQHIRFSLHRSNFSHQAQRIVLSHCHPLI
jgi:hypothetical protein